MVRGWWVLRAKTSTEKAEVTEVNNVTDMSIVPLRDLRLLRASVVKKSCELVCILEF